MEARDPAGLVSASGRHVPDRATRSPRLALSSGKPSTGSRRCSDTERPRMVIRHYHKCVPNLTRRDRDAPGAGGGQTAAGAAMTAVRRLPFGYRTDEGAYG